MEEDTKKKKKQVVRDYPEKPDKRYQDPELERRETEHQDRED